LLSQAEKNSLKIFSNVLENAKSFSERFLKQFVCPPLTADPETVTGCFFYIRALFAVSVNQHTIPTRLNLIVLTYARIDKTDILVRTLLDSMVSQIF
jgi:hypothetical protein